jgi:uncharacterized protein with HEPN domain
MIEAAEAAESFTSGRVRTDLDSDKQLAFALARAIEIFGEAATKISAETRAALPNVKWGLTIGMRNRIVHAYFDIDFDILWSTATEELAALLPLLRAALGSNDAPR